MKKLVVVLTFTALSLAACGSRNSQMACNPNDRDCGQQTTTVVSHDHTGAILAGGAGLAAGYALGHHRGVNQQQSYAYHQPYGQTVVQPYHRPYYPAQRTVIVHHYGNSRTVHIYHH